MTSATGPGSIPDGLTLLLTTPRVAPGLLTRDAWLALGAASLVLAADPGEPVPEAIASSGIEV